MKTHGLHEREVAGLLNDVMEAGGNTAELLEGVALEDVARKVNVVDSHLASIEHTLFKFFETNEDEVASLALLHGVA